MGLYLNVQQNVLFVKALQTASPGVLGRLNSQMELFITQTDQRKSAHYPCVCDASAMHLYRCLHSCLSMSLAKSIEILLFYRSM